ncbi:MAG: 16S rRNA (adenine(1518)-N(6)/adenine(1519)-N(6))-dimethyltransferase RsmA [Candidatus Izemoplasmatales bacterium]|nr:16S rRNA (adenine(1518)-N(6)/adenine(1519)-N(6))-dimethyltransferase RsmA [Candidatus Izemoplasmatales bacterium]MDD4987903.1 16S rRNA (adenine(1518)-N(6)/adenine(1519)-N(6))-dimethyltransferase RsmA [Candidatus Izemoplasmatales bacterium]NLF49188.1 16S rRNA (adenine(1518)-N(6)/adenine(1519)-N(6))-dimethyltransferase RsmA [Acholeplasmataceae bacterium]
MKKEPNTLSDINYLKKDGFRIKKHLGQNFLRNNTLIDQIIEAANLTKNTGVIEVGPGLGSMTGKLLNKAKKVLAYEIDTALIPFLKNKFSTQNNLFLLQMNILDAAIDEDIETYLSDCDDIVVVANLPYYITTPILMRFLETSTRIDRLILMMQLEVAKRITSRPSTKDYNALSVLVSYRANAEFLFEISRENFLPKPNVDSAIVRLNIQNEPRFPATNDRYFLTFVHQAFTQRRKTLLNNLLSAYPALDRPMIEQVLNRHDLDLTIRAEALTLADLVKLANDFYQLTHS